MPVPVRDTPLDRELYEEGLQDGARTTLLRITGAMLKQRFGDDPRCADVAASLVDLSDEERLAQIASATSLDDLER